MESFRSVSSFIDNVVAFFSYLSSEIQLPTC